jgi:hypothetical protein
MMNPSPDADAKQRANWSDDQLPPIDHPIFHADPTRAKAFADAA